MAVKLDSFPFKTNIYNLKINYYIQGSINLH
jgi:hypothetical protein